MPSTSCSNCTSYSHALDKHQAGEPLLHVGLFGNIVVYKEIYASEVELAMRFIPVLYLHTNVHACTLFHRDSP